MKTTEKKQFRELTDEELKDVTGGIPMTPTIIRDKEGFSEIEIEIRKGFNIFI